MPEMATHDGDSQTNKAALTYIINGPATRPPTDPMLSILSSEAIRDFEEKRQQQQQQPQRQQQRQQQATGQPPLYMSDRMETESMDPMDRPRSYSNSSRKRLPSDELQNSFPAKKQSKWSAREDALIIEFRNKHMKWKEISDELPGRSATSCRLHYQNYLEKRCVWNEDRKNKLARLYERYKKNFWSQIASEMEIPWRAAEVMHWQLGKEEMARRAGVPQFSFANASNDYGIAAANANQTPNLSRTKFDVSVMGLDDPPSPSPSELNSLCEGLKTLDRSRFDRETYDDSSAHEEERAHHAARLRKFGELNTAVLDLN